MSEIKEGDTVISNVSDGAISSILDMGLFGRKNPEFAIERLSAMITCAETEIKFLKEISNDKA